MYTKAIVLACLAVCVFGRTAPSYQNDIPQESARSDESSVFSYLGDLKYAYKVYQECSAADLSSCLKVKLIGAMDRVARSSDDITLVDGVTFVKEENAAPEEPEKTEAEIDASLPRSLGEKNDALNGIIADKVFKFFDSHSLQVKLPTSSDLTEESRGKKKKLGALLLLPLLLGGTLVPLALGALALLAGKALIVSKLALVLAGIIGLKKLFSNQHHGHEEVHVSSGHGSGWGRNFDQASAQNMAYNAYAPK